MFKLIIIITVVIYDVYGQGEQCTTPSNQGGTCVLVQQCPAIVEQIRSNNPNIARLGPQLQAVCGNRRVQNYPIICCADSGAVRSPTVTVPTNQIDVCTGSGNCINIRQCPSVLNELLANQKDQATIQKINQLNRACNSQSQIICCPNQPVIANSGTVRQSKLLTRADGCGWSNAIRTKVVGGEPAKKGAYPWIALLGYGNDVNGIDWNCGGSLITSNHILSAAHCLRRNLQVARLGEYDLRTDTESRHVDCKVVKSVPYENYDRVDGNGDIAVLYLDRSIQFSDHIKPICLPTSDPIRSQNFVGYRPFLAGWGLDSENRGRQANVLQELQVPVLENSVCMEQFRMARLLKSAKQFDSRTLCAGVLTGGKDACGGDSGGPLMAPTTINGDTYFYQIGIISWGNGCARVGYPGVFTRTSEFISWIEDRLNE